VYKHEYVPAPTVKLYSYVESYFKSVKQLLTFKLEFQSNLSVIWSGYYRLSTRVTIVRNTLIGHSHGVAATRLIVTMS